MPPAVNGRLRDPSTLANKGREWLQRFLGPTSLGTFFERYWERKHLYIPAVDPSAYADLLSQSEFDAFLARNDVRYPALQIVKDGRNVSLGDYTRQLKIGSYSSDGLVDMDLVAQAYRKGATVIVQIMQNSFANLAEFSTALGSFFHSKIDVHAFLTPAAAQGLSAHYDAASAFLIQLRGEKRWRLYDLEVEAPAPDQTFDARNPIKGDPIDEITLRSGDVVYLPRGLPHEGLTIESDSLHLTVVIFPKSWIEILSMVLRECQRNEEFRKTAVPPLVSTRNGVDLAKTWAKLVQQFTAQAGATGWSTIADIPQVVSPRLRRGRWT